MSCCADIPDGPGTIGRSRHQRGGTPMCPRARAAYNAYMREWRQQNLEHRRAYNRKWMAARRRGGSPDLSVGSIACVGCGADLMTVDLTHSCRVA